MNFKKNPLGLIVLTFALSLGSSFQAAAAPRTDVFNPENELSDQALEVMDSLSGNRLHSVYRRALGGRKSSKTQYVILVASDGRLHLSNTVPTYYLEGSSSWGSLILAYTAKGGIFFGTTTASALASGLTVANRVGGNGWIFSSYRQFFGGLAGVFIGSGPGALAGALYLYGDHWARKNMDLQDPENSGYARFYPIATYRNRVKGDRAFAEADSKFLRNASHLTLHPELILITKHVIFSEVKAQLEKSGFDKVSFR